jgi:anthranilate synthase component 2
LCGATNLGLLKVLVIDNYDSFTYNLVDLLRSIPGVEFQVVFNDQIDRDLVNSCHKILVSPGPGTPDEAGQLIELISNFYPTKSMLGICLGHQAIAQVFGAKLVNIPYPQHGKSVTIEMEEDPLFSGLPKKITGGLYHSWSVDPTFIPKELRVIASCGERVMAIRHAIYDIVGVQFHPESYATPHGIDILRNWIADGFSQ